MKYPPGKDLWLGKIKAGQSMADFTAQYPPHEKEQNGKYTIMYYYVVWPTPPKSIQMGQMSVLAKDGVLVAAGAWECCWNKEFFSVSPEDIKILK